jgi:pimeloyl-ACP methyl ester carboxylesterase/DNA-binding CsgD family transcriptional regulator
MVDLPGPRRHDDARGTSHTAVVAAGPLEVQRWPVRRATSPGRLRGEYDAPAESGRDSQQPSYCWPMTESGIQFLNFAGRRVAYAVTGSGPPLVAPAWWVSHLELDWADQEFRRFWESVAAGHTLVRYDRLGVGMSDHDVHDGDLTLDADVALLRTVLDELELGKVVLAGGSSGGCAATALAARLPDRVDRLLLYGAYADGSSVASPEVREAIVGAVRSHWGLGSRLLADILLGDASSLEQDRLARYQRAAASPETAALLLEGVYRNDVQAELEHVRAPTLVVHRRGDRAIPYRLGRELAAAIPGATLIPLDGNAHLPWAGDSSSVARALRSVLEPEPPARLTSAPLPVQLSGREREVLVLMARGLSDQEMAEQLVLSQHTVHRHVANIRHKLGRGNRAAMVAEAARLGLL